MRNTALPHMAHRFFPDFPASQTCAITLPLPPLRRHSSPLLLFPIQFAVSNTIWGYIIVCSCYAIGLYAIICQCTSAQHLSHHKICVIKWRLPRKNLYVMERVVHLVLVAWSSPLSTSYMSTGSTVLMLALQQAILHQDNELGASISFSAMVDTTHNCRWTCKRR